MPFCENCGTEHADEDRFCASCGNILPGAPRSTAPTGAPSTPVSGFPTALVAIIAVIAIALIAVAFLLLRGDDEAATAKTATAIPTETTGEIAAQSSRTEPATGNRTGGGTGEGTSGGRNSATTGETAQAAVTTDGLTLRHPAGVLPAGATVEIQPTVSPELPAGVTLVGDFYRITASAELTGLTTLRLPIPEDVAPDQLALYQLQADGQVVIYAGRVEGGFYIADLAGFTDEGRGSGPALKISPTAPPSWPPATPTNSKPSPAAAPATTNSTSPTTSARWPPHPSPP